jgi:hypothetical protein
MVVAVNAGPEPARLAVGLPELTGRILVDVALPGCEPGALVEVAGGRAEIEILARAGRVLRVEA